MCREGPIQLGSEARYERRGVCATQEVIAKESAGNGIALAVCAARETSTALHRILLLHLAQVEWKG